MDVSAFFPNQMSFSLCSQHWISTRACRWLFKEIFSVFNLLLMMYFLEAYLTSPLRLSSSSLAPVLGENDSAIIYQQWAVFHVHICAAKPCCQRSCAGVDRLGKSVGQHEELACGQCGPLICGRDLEGSGPVRQSLGLHGPVELSYIQWHCSSLWIITCFSFSVFCSLVTTLTRQSFSWGCIS